MISRYDATCVNNNKTIHYQNAYYGYISKNFRKTPLIILQINEQYFIIEINTYIQNDRKSSAVDGGYFLAHPPKYIFQISTFHSRTSTEKHLILFIKPVNYRYRYNLRLPNPEQLPDLLPFLQPPFLLPIINNL